MLEQKCHSSSQSAQCKVYLMIFGWLFYIDRKPILTYAKSLSTFFSEFSDYLETVVLCKEHLLIAGDFNIHVDVPEDSDSIKLLDLLESFSLRQHVVGPTHILGHTLDLVITRQSDQIIRSTPLVDFSDHASILCVLQSAKPSLTTKTVSYRKI